MTMTKNGIFEPQIDSSGYLPGNERDTYINAEDAAIRAILTDHVSDDEVKAATARWQSAQNATAAVEAHQRSSDVLDTQRNMVSQDSGSRAAAFEWMNGLLGNGLVLMSFLVPSIFSAIILMNLKFDFIAVNPSYGLLIGALAVGGLFGLVDLRKRLKRQRAQNRYDQALSLLAPLSFLIFVFFAGAAAYPESFSWWQEATTSGADQYELPDENAASAKALFIPPRVIVLLAMAIFDVLAGAMIHRFAYERLMPKGHDETSYTSEYRFISTQWATDARAELEEATKEKSDLEQRRAEIDALIARHRANAASHFDRLHTRYEASIMRAKADVLDAISRDHMADLIPLVQNGDMSNVHSF